MVKGGKKLLVELYFDGCCKGNPGIGAYGYVIKVNDEVIVSGNGVLGKCTNNIAEYQGLLNGLKKAIQMGFKEIVILGDSKLVINQINGEWKVKDNKLVSFYQECMELLSEFRFWKAKWISRELNKDADLIANKALKNF